MQSELYNPEVERIDHYGRPSKWFVDYPTDYLDDLAASLKEIELVLQLEFGVSMYLTWGSLLGAIREGDFIPHDFDIDVSYVSRARSPVGIQKEFHRIQEHFRRFKRLLKPAPSGKFMIGGALAPSGLYEHGIEIWTSFVVGQDFYAYPTIPGWLPARAVRPFRTAYLRGLPFSVPNQAELFLDRYLGSDWRSPKLPKDHTEKTGRYACFDFLYPD